MYDICCRAINETVFWAWAVAQGYLERVDGTDPETLEPWTSYVPTGNTIACAGPIYPIVSEPGVEPVVRHTDPHFDLQFLGEGESQDIFLKLRDQEIRNRREGRRQPRLSPLNTRNQPHLVEIPPHSHLVDRGAVPADQKTQAVANSTEDVVVIAQPMSDRKHFFEGS